MPIPRLNLSLGATLLCSLCSVTAGWPQVAVVNNYNNVTYPTGEPVRLQVNVSDQNASQVAVSRDGIPVWCQVEVLSGTTERVGSANLWVVAALAPGESAEYVVEIVDDPPTPPAPKWVSATCAGSTCTLGDSNAWTLVPSLAAWGGLGSSPPPPLLGVAYNTTGGLPVLRGGSVWSPLPAEWSLRAFSSTLTAIGPIFAEAKVEYEFSSSASGDVGVASWLVRVFPPSARPGPLVTERHNFSIDAGVELLMGGTTW